MHALSMLVFFADMVIFIGVFYCPSFLGCRISRRWGGRLRGVFFFIGSHGFLYVLLPLQTYVARKDIFLLGALLGGCWIQRRKKSLRTSVNNRQVPTVTNAADLCFGDRGATACNGERVGQERMRWRYEWEFGSSID
ncbi:hypothetical protein M413DRAFT_239577 [Hebeloma cylindrosporum]|uniref:Uncharacterized protein n=1 Tax=Hebeloma cylindrosporum TaxID=76867 RepID=A0A0C3C3V5_HEBCY|nr:hypothetical protein M413DRAFT_239577 [Hebeloma cylindrosporum h7]